MAKLKRTGKPLDFRMREMWARGHLSRGLLQAAGALGIFTPVLALANPTGGQVVAGSATIGTSGSNGVVVNQNSQRAAINWQQFSIGSNEYVQFNQPNSSSVVLNRVTGNNPSSIFGSIRANGQVFLINPNGILFAPGSTLDVSSLTASTLDISNSNFMAGRYVFAKDPGAPDATVINQGSINVTPGGYVVLSGDYVENDGVIQAQSGKVLLAAGGGTTLTLDNSGGLISYKIDAPTLARLAGVDNTGSIAALGGTVVMTADVANALTATAVNNSGLITAHSVRQQGGEIVLLSQGGGIENSGTLDASATQAGVPGGVVILHGDGKLQLKSTSDIEAGGDGAKGGFIDLSGHALDLKGTVNPGKGGDLLLDPSVIRIEGVGSSTGAGCSDCEGGVIHTKFIQNELNAGVDLTIVASNQIILGSGAHGAPLPTAITATAGSGKLSLKIGTLNFSTVSGSQHSITGGILSNGTPLNATFTPTTGGTIDITGLNVNIKGSFVASASKGTVKLGNVTAKNIAISGQLINFGNLKATGVSNNAISINAFGSDTGGGSVNGGSVSASNGGVHIVQSGGHTGISVGSITAKQGIFVSDGIAPAFLLNVKVNGNVTAGSHVALEAAGGNVTVSGAVKANSGSIFISAHASASRSGGNIDVTGAITAKGTVTDHGRVKLLAAGGGSSGVGSGGGNITVGGAINAAGSVTISASYLNSGHSFKVQTGAITAGNSGADSGGIHITMTGLNPVLKTGALLAQGPLHPCSSANEACHGRAGDIVLAVSPSGSSSGSIKIASAKSSHGEVSIDGGSGGVAPVTVTGIINAASNVEVSGKTVNTGAITAGNGADVDITGNVINVGGAITAIGGSVCLTGASAASHAMKITVTGNIKSGMVQVNANPATSASQGASIDLQGKVTSSLSGGIMISAVTTANVNTKITIGSMHAGGTGANAGHIDVTQQGASGGIFINGPVTAGGSVDVNASGGSISVHAISGSRIDLQDRGTAGGGITVNGNLNATSGVSIAASNHGGADVTVVGGITAGSNVQITADAGTHSGGNLTVSGTIKSSSGNVTLKTRGGSDSGGRLSVGKISAASSVHISASYTGTLTTGFIAKTGKITGENVGVTMKGIAPHFSATGITATGSAEAGSGVAVTLDATGAGHSSGVITITGAVNTSFENVHLNASHGVINVGGNIVTGGSGNVSVHGGQIHLGNITAGGSISISANAVGSHAGSITAGATNLWTGKFVNIHLGDSGGSKGGKIAIGAVTATGATSSNTQGGQVNINASLPTKNVTVTTGALTAAVSIGVSIQNTSGSATLGKLNAPAVHVSITNGNLTVGQLVKAGASLTASNGSITDTTTGSLNLVNDKFNTAHGVHLKAGTNITLTNDSFGSGGLSASAGGKLVETSAGILDVSDQVLKAKQLVLSAATIELGAATLTASSIQLSATSINNASGNGTITAAKGTIHATQGIFLVNENIVVSGAGPLISAASVDIDNAVVTGTGTLSVNATGNLDASGLHVTAGGFTAHGGSVDLTGATIAATKAVSIKSGKDVNISAAQIAGSAVGISAGRNITNGSSAGALTAGAGGLTLKAKSDVQLSGEKLTIGTGTGLISAAGSLGLAGATLAGGGTATLHAGTDISLTGATLTLGDVTMTAVGGSLDLTGVTANVTGQMSLHAKQDIILSGVHISTGIFAASASGTIHNGGAAGAITAAGMKFDAKKDIDLSSTVLTIGAGAVTGVTGDTALLQLLAATGLKPASAAPNGAFIAGGSLTLGDLTITGDYLVLQGSSVSILGKVTAPTSGLLVEVRPGDPAAGIGVEGQPASGQIFNLSNQAFFALFPGDTIVIGDDAETGSVQIGNNGPFILAGGTNLLFDTTGTITGLGNITGTGLVGSLVTVAGSSGGGNVVTAGEIDPSTTTTSLGDQTDKKHLGHGGQGLGNGEGQNGIIGTDTDTSSVCH